MARDIEAPPSADDRMARRAPKDKKSDDYATSGLKDLMSKKREEARKRMTFEEKFKTANTKEKKVMMAKGGYVKKADGCAKKGKTRGKMV
jgi:hypothetical protein